MVMFVILLELGCVDDAFENKQVVLYDGVLCIYESI